MVTWEDHSGADGSGYRAMAQRFDANGNPGVPTQLGDTSSSTFTFTGIDDYAVLNLGEGLDTAVFTRAYSDIAVRWTGLIKGPADDLLDRYSNMLEVMIANCETVEISKPILCPVLECPDDYLQSGLELLTAW